jgi:GTPase
MSESIPHVSGFVSIVGRPNAGKSTLLNAIVGAKLAIVTDKPQTTRTSVQGIYTTENAQVIFIDTPGIHRSDTLFNRRMMVEVRSALEARDLLLYLADASQRFLPEDAQALDMIRKSGTPVFLVLNKIDRVKVKHRLLPLIEQYKSAMEFEEYLPISALTGEGVDELLKAVIARMTEGPP